MSTTTRFCLTQADIPTHWYNLLADLPEPLPPPLHPGTKQPVTPEMMMAIFQAETMKIPKKKLFVRQQPQRPFRSLKPKSSS